MLTMFLPPLCAQWIELNIFKKKLQQKKNYHLPYVISKL